jgi:hypothetical protein
LWLWGVAAHSKKLYDGYNDFSFGKPCNFTKDRSACGVFADGWIYPNGMAVLVKR